MNKLFSHLTIADVQFKNRLVVSPMCQYSAKDGLINDWHLVHLGSRAVGGAGLIFTEACAVAPEGRITPFDIGLWNDEQVPGLKKITQFIKDQGAEPGIQLAHAGRKASNTPPWQGGQELNADQGGWVPLAPSAIAFHQQASPPAAMSMEQVQQLIANFSSAAKRSLDAGFQVIEIHAAHGYLIHEFLSPLSNLRTDAYGGSFENRVRLLLEIISAIQEVWPANLPLFVRISATDWVEGGWSLEESIKLSKLMKNQGVHLVDCSSGGNVQTHIPVAPGYQVTFANQIKKEAGVLTGAVGLITTAEQAEAILENGEADLIFMARELLRDPYFPLHAAASLGVDLVWPVQYQRAKK